MQPRERARKATLRVGNERAENGKLMGNGQNVLRFVVLYEGKNNGSVAKTSSALASPPQPGVSNTASGSALEQAALPKVSHHLYLLIRKTDNGSLLFYFRSSSRQAPPPPTCHQQPQGRAIHHRARGRCENLAGSTVRPGRPLRRRRSLQIQSRGRAA